ncbi:MAG: protein-L-isoaspartate O-methyltransferase [Phyllobacteriaceae bacterium]|nr:protein-L-isoaspartate O-methyltransferase [Phyllobacteriaceae bacterium]
MVESQLRAGGVLDRRVLAAMGQVPREIFVPEDRSSLAYIDAVHILDKGTGRFLSDPTTFARLVQLAKVGADDRVLDVGAGTGYSTAVLAALAREVVGLEADARLAEIAQTNISRLTPSNAQIVSGDEAGLGDAQFEVILIEGAVDAIPDALLKRLTDGGRLVALIREGGVGVATLVQRTGDDFQREASFNASLPPLDPRPSGDVFVF